MNSPRESPREMEAILADIRKHYKNNNYSQVAALAHRVPNTDDVTREMIVYCLMILGSWRLYKKLIPELEGNTRFKLQTSYFLYLRRKYQPALELNKSGHEGVDKCLQFLLNYKLRKFTEAFEILNDLEDSSDSCIVLANKLATFCQLSTLGKYNHVFLKITQTIAMETLSLFLKKVESGNKMVHDQDVYDTTFTQRSEVLFNFALAQSQMENFNDSLRILKAAQNLRRVELGTKITDSVVSIDLIYNLIHWQKELVTFRAKKPQDLSDSLSKLTEQIKSVDTIDHATLAIVLNNLYFLCDNKQGYSKYIQLFEIYRTPYTKHVNPSELTRIQENFIEMLITDENPKAATYLINRARSRRGWTPAIYASAIKVQPKLGVRKKMMRAGENLYPDSPEIAIQVLSMGNLKPRSCLRRIARVGIAILHSEEGFNLAFKYLMLDRRLSILNTLITSAKRTNLSTDLLLVAYICRKLQQWQLVVDICNCAKTEDSNYYAFQIMIMEASTHLGKDMSQSLKDKVKMPRCQKTIEKGNSAVFGRHTWISMLKTMVQPKISKKRSKRKPRLPKNVVITSTPLISDERWIKKSKRSYNRTTNKRKNTIQGGYDRPRSDQPIRSTAHNPVATGKVRRPR